MDDKVKKRQRESQRLLREKRKRAGIVEKRVRLSPDEMLLWSKFTLDLEKYRNARDADSL